MVLMDLGHVNDSIYFIENFEIFALNAYFQDILPFSP